MGIIMTIVKLTNGSRPLSVKLSMDLTQYCKACEILRDARAQLKTRIDH